MTCGGAVKLYFEPHPSGGTSWQIAIFGAGHITQALLPVLSPLPCTITVYDSRPEWLSKITPGRNIRSECIQDLARVVDTLSAETFLLCMTQGHKTDRPILSRALTHHNFPYVGCIGSKAKATVLRQELIADGVPLERARGFHCPIGLEFGTNHPHEIALSIAAQLLVERDRQPSPSKSGAASEPPQLANARYAPAASAEHRSENPPATSQGEPPGTS
jgi:xanthine dehydrogenase accessory factor